jgi:dolichyl-phosphate-mannose--protein O-mannosyl transferase
LFLSFNNKKNPGSLWLVKEGAHSPSCDIGKPIQCGEVIRLEHTDTHKNLHSHLFKAPLSGNQEVSGFGDDNGNGDTGDNWQVVH